MDKRKSSLAEQNVCRFCLSRDNTLGSLYDRSRTRKNEVHLTMQILSCVSVEVFPSDGMPSYICESCRFFMDMSYHFKQLCRQADEVMMQYKNGEPLQPLLWPSKLTKIYNAVNKLNNKKPIKTVLTEGGARVEVMDHSESDDEEDDEDADIYNIKIGGGDASDNKMASIKVLTGSEKPRAIKQKASPKKETGTDGTECWPCPECDNAYPLQQLLNLHVAQKHRAKTVECDQCDLKFFSKHDMLAHQICHSDETPFECIICNKKFKRLLLLKRHEKNRHADLPQYPCGLCPAKFLSKIEYKTHQEKHLNYNQRSHACDSCDKKFPTAVALRKHCEVAHGENSGFSCEYCPQSFQTPQKLSKHLKTHAGDRPYPCKYCDKSFLKSHHYTRHLRTKHSNVDDESGGELEPYRCGQCEDTFTTKDELIFHSAVHTTKNLTCPLCHEEFEDVDAVTEHVTSHVDGVQFMCDMCNLVFTSSEKLSLHREVKHNNKQEMSVDEDSMEEEEEDNISVKDEGDELVVELKNTEGFMLENVDMEEDEKTEAKSEETDTSQEDSNTDFNLKNQESVEIKTRSAKKQSAKDVVAATVAKISINATNKTVANKSETNQTASILRKAQEMKDKRQQKKDLNEKANEIENTTPASTNDKSLRLLVKDLQELKRTSNRENTKTLAKPEFMRTRRPQPVTSTPKNNNEEKKTPITKTATLEKRQVERRTNITKENKEPKDNKDSKSNGNDTNNKEEKEIKDAKESKTKNDAEKKEDKEIKSDQKEVKNAQKNVNIDKSNTDESIRRSARPSKIKDYAKLVRERQSSEDDSDNDEEYTETNRSETRTRQKKTPAKSPAAVPAALSKKRGRTRARKDISDVPNKVKKINDDKEMLQDSIDNNVDNSNDTKEDTSLETKKPVEKSVNKKSNDSEEIKNKSVPRVETPTKFVIDPNVASTSKDALLSNLQASTSTMLSPTGQSLKKVSMKALPPGVKPVPLPLGAKPELCEMQIGKKLVKVQKIVMTKAEVEAMAKKGLVEMKDGTMVLKQGIKLPTSGDAFTIKSKLMGEESPQTSKESPKKEKGQPTRCDIEEQT